MVDLQIRVSGAREVSRALDAAARRLPAAVDAAELEGAQLVADAARPRAPRRTGRLAASLGVIRDGDRVGAGSTVSYFWPVHSGTRVMPARPFVTQAGAQVEDRVVAAFEQAVEQVVRGI